MVAKGCVVCGNSIARVEFVPTGRVALTIERVCGTGVLANANRWAGKALLEVTVFVPRFARQPW